MCFGLTLFEVQRFSLVKESQGNMEQHKAERRFNTHFLYFVFSLLLRFQLHSRLYPEPNVVKAKGTIGSYTDLPP